MKKKKNSSQQKKPRAKLIGANSNIFNLLGIASHALRKAGLDEQRREMGDRVMKSSSFDEALGIICEYVDVC